MMPVVFLMPLKIITKKVLKSLVGYLGRLPLVGKMLNSTIQAMVLMRRYRNEILFLRGKHKTSNNHQSIVFFTVARGGSVYVVELLRKLAYEEGMALINLESYFWSCGRLLRRAYQLGKRSQLVYRQKGYFYGPFREFNREIPFLKEYKVILMLRDPRDVLVSRYFSEAYSHLLPARNQEVAERFLADREKALKMTVDEYVLELSDSLFNIYTLYCGELLNKGYVFFTKYEDMINDFESWLDAIINSLDFHPSKKLRDEIISTANFKVEKEDIYAHKRQVTPGDHRRKLKDETIRVLNIRFQEIIEKLSYTS